MSFYLGRAGRTLALNDPMSVQNRGGLLAKKGLQYITLTGTAGPLSPTTDITRLRDQLLGLDGNVDEEVIPVVVDSEPRLSGYYRIIGLSLTTDPAALARGWLRYTVDLEQVAGFAQPQFESIITGALLTNVVGAVSGDMVYFHSVPNAALEYFNGNGGSIVTRSSADGTMLWATGTGSVSSTARFYLPAASFYVGAATFEQGSPLQVVVGRQLAQSDLVNWRLSNGMVRVTPNASAGKIDVAHWKGAAWAAAKTYNFQRTNLAGTINGWTALTIMRNSPEETVIRLACTTTLGLASGGLVTIDLALRRGDRLVRGYLSASTTDHWQVARDTTEAATVITYGATTGAGNIRATANDGDGNRYVLLSDQAAITNDLVNGRVNQTGGNTTMDFGIGSEIGGSGAVSFDTATSIAQQYIAAQSEKQQVVAR